MVIKLWYTSKGEELSCFEGYSARGVSIITWECTLCQRSLRCSTALRMNLVGSYAQSFTHEYSGLGHVRAVAA